jgi:hypothetical protein
MWLARLLDIHRKDGVRLVKNGRCGELRYHAGDRYAAAYYERSGNPEFDLLVWLADMTKWSDGSLITSEERSLIETSFRAWAKHRGEVVEW